MKKTLRVLMVALVATILASGSAFAASVLNIANGTGGNAQDTAYTVGSEWLAAQSEITVDLGDAVPSPGVAAEDLSRVIYTPGIDLGIDNTLTFVVKNGALAPNVNYGLYDLDDTNAQVGTLVDFTADDNGNYTTLLIKMTAAVTEGTVLYLTEDGGTPVAGNSPQLETTPALLAAGSMTIEVESAADGTGANLNAPVAPAIALLAQTAQLSAELDGVTASVIDVESDRLEFVGDNSPSNFVTVIDAEVNQGIVVADAAFTLTVNGTQDAIEAVELDGDNLTLEDGVWTFTSEDSADLDDVELEIFVDGDTVLDTATYTVTLTIDPVEAGVADKVALDAETAYVWSINAMQAKVPYLALQAPGYLSFMKVVNESSSAADMSVDAVIYNVTDGVNEAVVTNAFVQSIPASSNTTVSEAALATALGLDPSKIYHVALTCTVVAPQNKIHVSAYQKDSVGRTDVPVLYNTNNEADGRSWQ